jgi:hypothetical protein
MSEPVFLMPEERLRAIRAHEQGKLGVSWGIHGNGAWQVRDFAEKHGWPTPLFGFKKAFIAKMLESDENFELAVMNSGIDVYIPKGERL